ncbi:hypothetical protein POPTR_002G204750v4 [Populus trichocarpa]|uniref:Uncharacterized protein n=1 Tax=Populus trichocarpa TaxID=3694 RepID=A0ACC0TF04_POPTR|nr:hypothetical protein POPTR_002G204750v4 [Populus trichocarpa]
MYAMIKILICQEGQTAHCIYLTPCRFAYPARTEYVYRYYVGDCNYTVQIGQKEMILIGNLGAYQFWQRIFKVEKLGRDGFFSSESLFHSMKKALVRCQIQSHYWKANNMYLHCSRLLTFSLATMLPDFKNICTMSLGNM